MDIRRSVFLVICGLLASQPLVADVNKDIRISSGMQTGDQSTVNGSITVETGAIVDGSVKTVNGRISIDDQTRVGNAETVNGSIRVGAGSSVGKIDSVNGSIKLAESVTVDGAISVVNGKITAGRGTSVAGSLSNINGEIELTNASVGGDLSTVSGDVSLHEISIVHGNLIVEKPGGWGWDRDRRKPRIVIGPGSSVVGNIELEREVELFISETAEVGGVTGKMSMDDAVRFRGERP